MVVAQLALLLLQVVTVYLQMMVGQCVRQALTHYTYLAGTTKTLTNKTLTAPKFADGGFIADANGNELIMLQTASSAVNQLEVTNAASGGSVVVGASGDDSNIDIDISPKGTGEVNIANRKP